ncbi:hypothetical protein [Roseateles sp. MS654]|uniref:hypothetical protein n=1 Tax=Roseateles sp. MS654 TaxID=3412685 RepID=UPI003C2B4609
MKTLFKTLLILGLVLVLGAMLLGWGVLHLMGDVPGVHLSIDGDDVFLTGFDIADALGAGLGVIIAIGVMCLVVPLVLLLGIGLPLLIMGALVLAGIAALLGVGAIVGSPLIFIGLLVWLIVRDKPRKPRVEPVAPATPMASASPAQPSFHV